MEKLKRNVVLALGLGIGVYLALAVFSGSAPTEQPYPGLRFYKQIGLQAWPNWTGTAQGVQDLYSQYMKPEYHGDGDVYFTVRKNLRWADVLVNEDITPTHAQMRNPNWSGYTWNQGTDEVKDMLDAPCVREGKCKVSLQLAVSATSGDSTPNFMVNEGLGWVRDKDLRHTKFYKPEAVRYASEFLMAALDRYANDPRIGSVKLGEYYPGPEKPADWDRDAFIAGYGDLLDTIAANVSRDANGDRVTIYQSNPIMGDGLSAADFKRTNIGIAASDPYMFEDGNSYRRDLHGVVPMAAPGDEPHHNSGYQTTYDGKPNPWGYRAGQKVTLTLPQVAWFYGHKGPMPMDQEFIIGFGIRDRFQPTLDQFGPGGTYRNQWGGVPFAK